MNPAVEVGASAVDDPAPTSPRPTLRHVPALDGLRGVAVLAVLVHHGGHLTGGWLGVDLFFVLSGYLITSLLLVEVRDTGRVDLARFWSRRARRLLPALLLLVVGVGVYAVAVARPVDRGAIRADGFAALAYVANWRAIFHGSDYWDAAVAPSPFQHTWSLAIEEQFYVVWPLLVVLAARLGARGAAPARIRAWCGFAATVSALLLVGLHATGAADSRLYEGTDTRAFALLLGAGLAAHRAVRSAAGGPPTPPLAEPAGVVAAVLLAMAWIALPGTSPWVYRGLLPACSVLAVLIVSAAAEPSSPVIGRALRVRGLRWLGLISYGLYLWHWPVYLVLTADRVGMDGIGLLALRLGVSVLAALASYAYVEHPVRTRTRPWPRPAVLTVAAVLLASSVLVWGTRDQLDPASLGRLDETAALRTPRASGADRSGDPGGRRPRVLVVGDSVAVSLVLPIAKGELAVPVDLDTAAIPDCSLFADSGLRQRGAAGERSTSGPCGRGYAAALARTRPDVVVAVFGAPPVGSVEVGGRYRTACEPEYRQALRSRLVRMAEQLTAGGATLLLATVAESTWPWRPTDEPRLVTCANEVRRQVARRVPRVQILELHRHICPDGPCSVGSDPELRPDGLHFGGAPGQAVTRWVVAQARRAVP